MNITRLRVENVTPEKVKAVHGVLKKNKAFWVKGEFDKQEDGVYRVHVKKDCSQQLIQAGFPAFVLA
jgi:hypothetical protein